MTDKERIIMDAFKAKLEGNDKELEKAILALREYAKKDLSETDADLEEAADAYNEEYSKYLCGLNTAFKAGANWQKKQMINKACEWLKSYRQDTCDGTGYIAGIVNDKTIEEFRKAMEDEK